MTIKIPVNHSFFDTDDDDDNKIISSSRSEELEDNQIVLCDECGTGNVILQQHYQVDNNKMICPQCGKIYDPKFEYLKHKDIEYTIIDSDDAPNNTGIISYIDNETKPQTSKTYIRRRLEIDEIPDYLRQEIEHIHNKMKYKFVKSF